jgi:LysM repeat protein
MMAQIHRAGALAHPSAAHAVDQIRVQAGDTLSSMAHRLWGHANRWPLLWYHNRHLIKNPNMIEAGWVLKIPTDPAVPQHIVNAAYAAIPPPPPPPPPPAPVNSAPVSSGIAANTVPVSSPPQTSYSAAPGSFQQCVIQRESGGNAGAVNPSSGAGGLYGFLPSTWQALGHSGLPENASVAEQNQAFQQEYAQGGTSAWAPYDGC